MSKFVLIVVEPSEFCFGSGSFNWYLSLIVASTLFRCSIRSFISRQVTMSRDPDDTDYISIVFRLQEGISDLDLSAAVGVA